jgi:DNA mismatch endonuclease, patch repair protein
VPDTVSPETRSRIMRRVRSRDTGPEMLLRRALWAGGVRGWRCHRKDVLGVPDLSWRRHRVAVFVDSAWWHGHPSRWRPGRLPEKWDVKIARNRERDLQVNRGLERTGWTVLRIWDFELKADIGASVERVRAALLVRRETPELLRPPQEASDAARR